MAIQDFSTDEVRIRHEQQFIQAPNNQTAGEAMGVGVFCQIGADNKYFAVAHTERASHLVVKSVNAATVGSIASGEQVLAITGGPGIVRIPFKSDVVAGRKITTDADGFAVAWDESTSSTDAHIVGSALEDLTLDEDGIAWGDALLSLPSSIISNITTSETVDG